MNNEMDKIKTLESVLEHIKGTFIGKDEIVDLLAICLIANENLFLLGPPGTAKSAIVRAFSECIKEGNNFEYLLTRFTEPNEIFGPFDIRALKEGQLVTNTEGMMPEASIVFLDEIFNANSAILNSLLMALNEKVFRRGRETKKLPTLTFIGASNLLPEDESLNALLDRFLIRVRCDYVNPDSLEQVLLAGWNIGHGRVGDRPVINTSQIVDMQKECRKIDLSPILKEYVDVVHNLRNTGIKVSDRRAVKMQNLIAASAYLCHRDTAVLSDLWVLKYIWDTEDQIELLVGVINNVIEKEEAQQSHPQALQSNMPNADLIVKEVTFLIEKWDTDLSLPEQSAIKDKLGYLQSRCEWISNQEQKTFIQEKIDALWSNMMQTT